MLASRPGLGSNAVRVYFETTFDGIGLGLVLESMALSGGLVQARDLIF